MCFDDEHYIVIHIFIVKQLNYKKYNLGIFKIVSKTACFYFLFHIDLLYV